MTPSRRPPLLSFTLLALAGCELTDKVCIGDCPEQVETGAVASDSASSTGPFDSDSVGEATITDVDMTSGEPIDVCDLTDDLAIGAGCMDGVQAPGELCFVLGQGGPGFSEGIVSTVPGLFDGIGGVDLLVSFPDRTVVAKLDGPAPYLDMSSVPWPGPFPADALHFTGAGDLDGDGDIDAVGRRVGGTGDTVEILLTDGAAGLAEANSVSVGTIVFGPAVVDWDLDGDLDLLVVTPPDPGVENAILLRGDGTGNFTVQSQFGFAPSAPPLAVGALHLDGKPNDIVAAGEEGSIVGTTVGAIVELGADAVVLRLEIAELNGDGLGDIVALVEDSVTGGTSLAVLLQGLDGDEPSFTVTSFPLGCGASTFALGDIDQDGALDVAAGGPGQNFVTIRRGDGLGGFPQLLTVGSSGADELYIADFNGDGSTDFAVVNYTWGSFGVSPNLP